MSAAGVLDIGKVGDRLQGQAPDSRPAHCMRTAAMRKGGGGTVASRGNSQPSMWPGLAAVLDLAVLRPDHERPALAALQHPAPELLRHGLHLRLVADGTEKPPGMTKSFGHVLVSA